MPVTIQGVEIPDKAISESKLTINQKKIVFLAKDIKNIDAYCQATSGFGPKSQALLHRLLKQHQDTKLDWFKIAKWLNLHCDPDSPHHDDFVDFNNAMNIRRVDSKSISVWMERDTYVNSQGGGRAFMAYVQEQANKVKGVTARFEWNHLRIIKE